MNVLSVLTTVVVTKFAITRVGHTNAATRSTVDQDYGTMKSAEDVKILMNVLLVITHVTQTKFVGTHLVVSHVIAYRVI